MVRKVKKTKKLLFIIFLTAILLLASACDHASVAEIEYVFDGYKLIDSYFPSKIDKDSFGRVLFCQESLDDEKQCLYLVAQSFFDEKEESRMTYIKDKNYYFDYDGKGRETQEFKRFLEENDWENPVKLTLDKRGEGLLRKDEDIEEVLSNFKMFSRENIENGLNLIIENMNLTDCEVNTYSQDQFCRTLIGVTIKSKTQGEKDKIGAIILNCNLKTQTYYLKDNYFTEIRLDHYAEDLEEFKKSNNWGEPLTVEDLNAMDKYVVSASAN